VHGKTKIAHFIDTPTRKNPDEMGKNCLFRLRHHVQIPKLSHINSYITTTCRKKQKYAVFSFQKQRTNKFASKISNKWAL